MFSKEENWLLKEKYNNKLEVEKNPNFLKDLKRLKAGEPLDYVIGFTNFLECKIDLSQKPLIPRPETEFWVERAIEDIAKLEDKTNTVKCLDLFTGSGCVGIAVLCKTGILLCDIADSQLKCLKQVKINCRINKINKKRYRVIKSDVFSNIKGKYDYIFTNPPYIPTKNKDNVQKSVLDFEPKSALFGGKDGLFYIEKFLNQAKNFLKPNGFIFMEFSPEQKPEIEKLLRKNKYSNWQFNKDQFNRWRWVRVI